MAQLLECWFSMLEIWGQFLAMHKQVDGASLYPQHSRGEGRQEDLEFKVRSEMPDALEL